MKRTHNRAGFTLIELLVVIAIIAVLSAILFPVFAQARNKARQSACSSNEKQLMLGISQYVQDYDEELPPIWSADGGLSSRVNTVLWNQIIFSYVKNKEVFICPEDQYKNAPVSSWAEPNPTNNMKPFHSSYIPNIQVFNPWLPIGLGAINSSSSTICLTDGAMTSNTSAPFVSDKSNKKSEAWILQDPTSDNNNTYGSNLVSTSNPDWAAPGVVHSGMVEVGFMDGHIKAMKPEKFYYGNSEWLDISKGGGQ